MGSVAEQLDKHRALIARLNQAEAERDEARRVAVLLEDGAAPCEDCGQPNHYSAGGKQCTMCASGDEADKELSRTIGRWRRR